MPVAGSCTGVAPIPRKHETAVQPASVRLWRGIRNLPWAHLAAALAVAVLSAADAQTPASGVGAQTSAAASTRPAEKFEGRKRERRKEREEQRQREIREADKAERKAD